MWKRAIRVKRIRPEPARARNPAFPMRTEFTGPKPRRILFVCLGNICRSPAAEGVFAKLATEAGLAKAGVTWDSCGTGGWHAGELADPRMRAAAKRRGYELTHNARQLRPEDFADFDLIVTMDEDNFSRVRKLAPDRAAQAKLSPMAHWLKKHEAGRIPDPYYDGPEAFEHVLDLLEDACAGLIAALSKGH